MKAHWLTAAATGVLLKQEIADTSAPIKDRPYQAMSVVAAPSCS